MTPEQLARPDSEHAHQTALFCWCAQNFAAYPQLHLLHAIPNGGLRSKAQAAKLKAEGVKSGVPDCFLPVSRNGFHGLYIEMKKPAARPKRAGKGGVSDEQAEFVRNVTAEGYKAVVCYTWQEAANELYRYLEG